MVGRGSASVGLRATRREWLLVLPELAEPCSMDMR